MFTQSEELRKLFLDFFQKRKHRIIPSSSLIPENDSSVLFTTAGMQQFKLYYSGKKNPLRDKHLELGEPLGTKNVASCQKCFRTTDIMSVGDASHLTFFEMLGNFSFGGYFKKEAINYAWEFIHRVLKVPKERISITVFGGDEEVPFDEQSFQIWKKLGLEGRITKGKRKDNFWGPTGKEGPCGPTTEIYIDGIEIWNLVFNEYYQQLDGKLIPLASKGVDTGMGLERLCLIRQYPQNKEKTVFDTDLFRDLMDYLHQQSQEQVTESVYRIIADHLRSAVFLAGAGLLPSNLGQGYVLRRLIRRIIRYEKIAQLGNDWLEPAIEIVVNKYIAFYPELKEKKNIYSIIREEGKKFAKTLEKGTKEWKKVASHLEQQKKRIVPGSIAFRLYESYGFPLELLEEMAKENNLQVDKVGFEKEFQQHRLISRAGREKKFGGHGLKDNQDYTAEERKKVIRLHTATHLLLAALRNILGADIIQRGSDISPERLRFDFSFPRKLSEEELKKIEDWVNKRVQENLPVSHYLTTYEKAIEEGAIGSFKDRYPKKVTVYEIKSKEGKVYSKEICAGPHVKSTREVGRFKIIKEKSAAQGIRRIKATVE